MNNQTILILIAIGVLAALLFAIPSNENFYGTVPYTPANSDLLTAESSLDCGKTPNAPGCQPVPDVGPTPKITTCVPDNGQWSTPGTGAQGRSTLNSPCCQPPDYATGNYKSCDDELDLANPIDQCISDCCGNAIAEANNYDVSWYPMAKCGCSLWCNNQNVTHFKKYGTAVHYITGDLAEAKTSDSNDFIGGGSNFSGA